jgi:LysM repeat protein
MRWKRLFFFLLINVIVSALTTTLVLFLWDRSQNTIPEERGSNSPGFVIPTDAISTSTSVPDKIQPYLVAEGETLSEIAQTFNISVDELLVINGLTETDTVGVGTTIFVPVSGEEGSDLPTAGGMLPSSTNAGQVEIVGIFGAGDLTSERVQIRGLGEGTLSLTGWRLQDEDGNVYTFPKITLFSSGAVDVYSGSGVDNVVSLHWRSDQPIWDQGETAILLAESGTIQATYTLP